jgi:hypothetical protein
MIIPDQPIFHDPLKVDERVQKIVQKWGRVITIPPEEFLMHILNTRGYDSTISKFSKTTTPRK